MAETPTSGRKLTVRSPDSVNVVRDSVGRSPKTSAAKRRSFRTCALKNVSCKMSVHTASFWHLLGEKRGGGSTGGRYLSLDHYFHRKTTRSELVEHLHIRDVIPKEVIITLFVFIIVLSFLGNSYVILSGVFVKQMKSATMIFVLSKSGSDLLVGIVVSLFALTQTLSPGQSSGVRCKLPLYVEYICITASVFSLLAVGLDRYIAVVHPTNKTLTSKKAAILVVALWIFAVVFSLQLTFRDERLLEHKDCSLLFEDKDENLLSRSIDFGILFIIPIIVLSYMYTKIAKNQWTRGATKDVQRKRKLVKYLIISLTVFLLAWCPFYVVGIVGDLMLKSGYEDTHNIMHSRPYLIFEFTFAVMALSNSFVSPLVYIKFFSPIQRGTKVMIMTILGKPATYSQHNCSALTTATTKRARSSPTGLSAAGPTSRPGMSTASSNVSYHVEQAQNKLKDEVATDDTGDE